MSDTNSEILLSVIIPCFNEEKVIPETFRRITDNLVSLNHLYELIFINDGSTDHTSMVLNDLARNHSEVRVLHLSRNFGHQPAISAGLHASRGGYAVILDADLQDPPECIPEMMKIAERDAADIVYGVRKARAGESFFKKWSASLFYKTLNKLSEIEIPENTGDFRLISRRAIDQFCNLHEKNKYIRGLFSWIGFKQLPYYYERDSRYAGKSHFSLRAMLNFASRGITYFSKKPLLLATNLGLFCFIVGLALIIYVLISKYHYHQVVSGWASLLITIVFFGGIQLISMGLLGQYLGSIFDEVKNRPEYIIEKEISKYKGL